MKWIKSKPRGPKSERILGGWPGGEHMLKDGRQTLITLFYVPETYEEEVPTGRDGDFTTRTVTRERFGYRACLEGLDPDCYVWLRAKTLEGAKRQAVRRLGDIASDQIYSLSALVRNLLACGRGGGV